MDIIDTWKIYYATLVGFQSHPKNGGLKAITDELLDEAADVATRMVTRTKTIEEIHRRISEARW